MLAVLEEVRFVTFFFEVLLTGVDASSDAAIFLFRVVDLFDVATGFTVLAFALVFLPATVDLDALDGLDFAAVLLSEEVLFLFRVAARGSFLVLSFPPEFVDEGEDAARRLRLASRVLRLTVDRPSRPIVSRARTEDPTEILGFRDFRKLLRPFKTTDFPIGLV